MTADRRVLVYPDEKTLTAAVAARFISTICRVLVDKAEANVVLTGGTVGIAVLAAINESPARDTIDWPRVTLWWGDERWVPHGRADRNDTQARAALLDHVALRPERIHWFGASDGPDDLDSAADRYARELAAAAATGSTLPQFDISFLGVGPDGHIASLFPNRDGIRVTDATVIPVRNCPKPPPERLSLTLPVINTSDRIWLVVAGADKASAVGLALADASTVEVPAAGVHGRQDTVFFVDQAAASSLPENLIASEE